MLKRTLLRLITGGYLAYRKRISSDDLKKQTILTLQDFLLKVESLSPAQLEAHPSSGKWSAQEIVFHAVNGAKGLLRICEGLHNNQDVPDMDRSAMGRTRQVPQEDLVLLCRRVIDRTEQFQFVSASTKICAHPVVGKNDFKGWLVINLVHLQRHYRQLLRTTEAA